MIVHVVETCLVTVGDGPEVWVLFSIHATSAGASKIAESMERVYAAVKKPKLVRVRELRVQA